MKDLTRLESDRLYTLDVLKGLAILFVIVTHLGWEDTDRLRLGFPFWIEMAVPIFMLITGYVQAASYVRSGGITRTSLKDKIRKSLIRYTVPYVLTYGLELLFFVAYTFYTAKTITAANVWDFFLKFFQGGWGPGSYYYPVLVQITFLFPCIYLVVDKLRGKGVLLLAGINVLYEIIKLAWGINDATYRMLAFRYIFLLAVGCYFYKQRECAFNRCALAASALGGGIYITAVNYLGVVPLIFTQWTSTCMVSSLWVVPLVYGVTKMQVRCRLLEKIGSASYAIFLTQMVWFGCGGRKFVAMLSNSFWVECVVTVVVCVLAGLVFHRITSILTKKALSNA